MVFFLGSTSMSFSQGISKTQDDSRKEAERLWELAIKAKGGRKKLHTVRNIVVSSTSKVKFPYSKPYDNIVESLIVFPDKRWTWNDNRPSVFGLRMEMYNYQTNMKYYKVLGDTETDLILIESNQQTQSDSKMSGLVYELMETYWLKPMPAKATSEKVNSRRVDIVQTTLNGERFDFALDKTTHLPVQITYYYYQPLIKQNLVNKVNILEYSEIDGIMMPTKTSFPDESGVDNKTFQFNVEYNEDIFKTPPPFEAGPEAWKVKKKL